MTSSTVRVLDVPPYNAFIGFCSVSVEVPGLEGHVQQFRGAWLWERKEERRNVFSKIQDMGTSIVRKVVVNESSEGQVQYRCTYKLEGSDNISSTDEESISVIGKLKEHLLLSDTKRFELFSTPFIIEY